MWIFLNNSFLSIVAPTPGSAMAEKDMLCVRARIKADIGRVFPGAAVFTNTGTDYAYRAFVPRARVAEALAAKAKAINYTNFKDSVQEDRRHHFYMRVWQIMSELQLQGRTRLWPR